MPRSYSFDHFQAAKPDISKRPRPGEKPPVGGAPRPPSAGLRYGKRHAKTEELYHAREMEKQLEALAEEDDALGEERAQAAEPRPIGRAGPLTGPPIGALPPPLEQPPNFLWRDALIDGQRQIGGLWRASREIWAMGRRLARLPFEWGRWAVQRYVPFSSQRA